MKRLLRPALAAFLVCCPAFAGPVSPVSMPGVVLFSGTSPAAPGTTLGAQLAVPLDGASYCTISARLAGATGGTLDIYIQSSNNNGAAGSWTDAIHFPQLAGGAAAVGYVATIGHGTGGTAPVVVNSADGTPILAANVVVPHSLGNNLRVVLVAGASTSAGATETITAYCASL
jgi:hypothetical protein